MKQLYNLGEYIKLYYQDFLPASYDPKKLYARSTDVDRTLLSASSFLAGLYKPNTDQLWNNIQNISAWLPIPVHTVPTNMDPVFKL